MSDFKRAQVIMLPTKQNTKLMFNSLTKGLTDITNSLYCFKEWLDINPSIKPQHLYIISDDKIKEGDWCYSNEYDDGLIFKADKRFFEIGLEAKKIIATTELIKIYKESFEFGSPQNEEYLPQPSQQFIEKYIESYNKGEIITNVLVEYQNLCGLERGQCDCSYQNIDCQYLKDKLKINPKDNTITIKKLKDSWNREEVVELLYKFNKMGIRPIDKFIEETL